jgi:hypothetical protein
MAVRLSGDAMRLRSAVFSLAACLLGGCASDGPDTGGRPARYVYDDWLYYDQGWYDDDFWIWADENPECCDDRDDIEQALEHWYDDLDPGQQQAVRGRVQTWMDEHGVVPAAGQSAKDLVLETASERWTALTPVERQRWLDQRRSRIEQRLATGSASRLTSDQRAVLSERAASLSPEQRAALRESAQGTSFDRASGRGAAGAYRSVSLHPTPGRAGLSGGTRFQAARGGGRAGRGGRSR